MDFAIKGIREKMNDLISRQVAIDALKEYRAFYCDNTPDTFSKLSYPEKCRVDELDTAIATLVNLPSAQPEQQWVPVSERLPENCEEVNVTWVNNNPGSYYDSIKGKPFTGSAVYCNGRWFWYSSVCADYCIEYGFSSCDEMDDAIEVIAWMPLPEPCNLKRERSEDA